MAQRQDCRSTIGRVVISEGGASQTVNVT